ncbi:MAG TPA: hypothetical protein VNK82_05540 [Terriglobales bacterium]|nr:hypothetical protein [Terriglobales bacterium]
MAKRTRTLNAYANYKRLKAAEERMSMALARPMVVDIPLRREEETRPAPVARCVEKRTDGRECGRPAEEGSTRCGMHRQWYQTAAAAMGFPFPGDAIGMHDMLARLFTLVAQGTFPPEHAKVLLDICRLMQKNLREYEGLREWEERNG